MKRTYRFALPGFALFLMSFSHALQAQQTEPQKPDTTKRAMPSPTDAEDRNMVFEKSEVSASMDKTEWRKHLEQHLLPVVENAAVAGIKPGKYTVNVRFIVEKDGSLSDVRALNDFGYGLALGAIDVVKTGPKWKPAMQNGRIVRSYHTQPINFVIQGK